MPPPPPHPLGSRNATRRGGHRAVRGEVSGPVNTAAEPEMREMKTLLKSLAPRVIVASSGHGAPLALTSQQGAPGAASTVASTSRQGAALIAAATVASARAWPIVDGQVGAVPTLALHARVSEKMRGRV